jgi:uroporphyrinogen-III decarboxylase
MPHDRALVTATPEQLAAQVEKLYAAMGNRGRMVGPGCTFPPETPGENLHAIRKAVEF